jgi:UDP-N-acetylmuramoyl-tripeptide--D-alanyl-D-alanine ligase
MQKAMHTIAGKLKRFAIDAILHRMLSLPILESYVVFWGRLVRRIRKPFVIAVTGSVGKSTTTAMIATVLADPRAQRIVGRVGNSVGNMNDDIGVAATLLRFGKPYELPWAYWRRPMVFFAIAARGLRALLGRYPDVMVLEVGLGPTACFDRIVTLARPDIAVVTTIGAAHLAQLKTIDGVVREKGKLVAAVPYSGLVVIGDDHDFVGAIEAMARAPVAKASGRGIELSRRLTKTVCEYLGVPEEIIDSGLRDFRNLDGRLNLLHLGAITVIDDSYNATTLSMRLGLDTLAQTAKPGQRRVAILGHMAALGEESVRYHEEVGSYARNCADVVIGVGDLARHYGADHWFEDSAACATELDRLVYDGDCVFVKGSFAAKMGCVVQGLRELSARQHRSNSGPQVERDEPALQVNDAKAAPTLIDEM